VKYWAIVAVLSVLGAGCAGEPGAACEGDPAECAQAHWEAVVSKHTQDPAILSDRCVHAVQSAVLTTRADDEMSRLCDGYAIGCLAHYADDGSQVYLSDSESGQRVNTAVHELLHVILQCESRNGDIGHKWEGWRGAYETGY